MPNYKVVIPKVLVKPASLAWRLSKERRARTDLIRTKVPMRLDAWLMNEAGRMLCMHRNQNSNGVQTACVVMWTRRRSSRIRLLLYQIRTLNKHETRILALRDPPLFRLDRVQDRAHEYHHKQSRCREATAEFADRYAAASIDRRVSPTSRASLRAIAKPKRAAAMETDLSARLPEDVLADVLRRLAPRFLAVSRCVCTAWRAVVDAHPLLRAELLPHRLASILLNFRGLRITEVFSRPSTSTHPSGEHEHRLDYTCFPWSSVQDHCNGLLLLRNRVINPATRWRASLPPPPPPRMGENSLTRGQLVYDPAVSPHYEVFLIPHFRYRIDDPDDVTIPIDYDHTVEQSEWPPSPCVLDVFSSKTGLWEERSFDREGKVAGTVADMRLDFPEKRNAVYWRGVLYVHCQTDFVMRISLSNNKIQVIKPPIGFRPNEHIGFHLEKSEKGVYYVALDDPCRLKVWFLEESRCQTEWTLKHDADLTRLALSRDHEQIQARGPWTLQDMNYQYDTKWRYDEYDNVEAPMAEQFEWDSEDEDHEEGSNNEGTCQRYDHGYLGILGFHPYREIVFLSESIRRGLAYHLNGSKVEDLGNLYPTRYDRHLPNEQELTQSFPFTPCWTMGPTTESK
ncbi:hypothetical protein ACP70R_024732 [Stipagrostis hirtigluma subsp. patula]